MDHISLNSYNHNSKLVNALDHFKAVNSFVDVTLVCEGHTVKAHKIMLSAGSNVFHRLLLANPAEHPILILAETKYDTLRMMMDFLYKGRIDVPRNDLRKLLAVAVTYEMNELKELCEENLNNKKEDSERNLHPRSKSPNWKGSSPNKKRQRRQSSDSDILYDATVLKREVDDSSLRSEQPEISQLPNALTVSAQTECHEFCPQIADTRSLNKISVESATGNDLTVTRIQDLQKNDAVTECDVQPLKELENNLVPIEEATVTVRSRYNEKSDDSESDTQNKLKFNTKRRRSKIWKYFTAVSNTYAVCKLCMGKFSYKTTVTNLNKHILKKHRKFDPKHPPKLPEVPLLRIQEEQLEVFEEIDLNSVDDEAGVQNAEHLQDEEALEEDDYDSDTQNKLDFTKRKRRSTVWEYFTAMDNDYAVCKLCMHKLSYKTTVTNLTKHLQKQHQQFDPKHPPKLPEVPLLRVQNEQLELFEEIDSNSEDEADDQDGEHPKYEEALDEGVPSTSSPCILKIT